MHTSTDAIKTLMTSSRKLLSKGVYIYGAPGKRAEATAEAMIQWAQPMNTVRPVEMGS